MLFLLCFCCFAACGAPEGGGGGAGLLEPEAWCEVTLEARCARQVSCGVALENEATTEAACLAEALPRCAPRAGSWSSSVAAGRAGFDGGALASCGAGWGEVGCRELAGGASPSACGEVFSGGAGEGEACFTDVECGGGLRCAAGGRCPGVCVADVEADPGATCLLTGCDAAAYCAGSVCRPRLARDAACEGEGQCLAGLFCGKDVGAPELRCRPQKEAGAVCFTRAMCAAGQGCLPGGDVSRCGEAVAEGGFCGSDEVCAGGLVCDLSAGRCAPPLAEGAACVSSAACAPGLYCWEDHPEGARCREEGKVGVPPGALCNPALDRCALGHYCRIGDRSPEVGACALLPGLGEPCEDFSRNLNSACREGVCLGGVCALLKAPGEACEARAECLSGACAAGSCAPFEEVVCGLE